MINADRTHQIKLEDIKMSNQELKAEFKEELKAVKSLVDHINGK